MNQEDVKVTFYLKRNETNAEGRCPVMGRLTVGRSESVFSAKMLASCSLWTSGRAKGKSAEAVEINRRLDELRASAISIYREQSAVRERVTAEEVKCLLLGMAFGQETLLGYFRSYIEHFEKRVGVNRTIKSARTYHCTYEHVGRFLSERLRLSDIPFSALDRSFIDKFDPFAGYEPPRPERMRRYLTREGLQRLMTTPLPTPRLYLVRDLFLFSCYTGISYGDMCRLTAANLETAEDGTTWIKATREKTNVEFEIPLLDLPLRILDKYRDTTSDGKLLPMYGNAELNKGLKQLAATCGIDHKLTFHMARHTYATEITLSHGIPMETVSRMLGHSRVDTTQIYAQVTDNKIDTDTQALDERIAERFTVAI